MVTASAGALTSNENRNSLSYGRTRSAVCDRPARLTEAFTELGPAWGRWVHACLPGDAISFALRDSPPPPARGARIPPGVRPRGETC